MLILGLTKTTLLDYPGRVAATIFTGGCNFRCPYCHNGKLVLNPSAESKINEEDIFDFLKKRKGILEGVCISGGEPTLHADLVEFIEKIRCLGYKIKLDTNGTRPDIVERLIKEKLIDYVAMDIKNSLEKYPETTASDIDYTEKIKESVKMLLDGNVEYEFRTTIVRDFHNREDIIKMAELIDGAKIWYIQDFKDSDNVILKGCSGYTESELKNLFSGIDNVEIKFRGIDI